MRAALPKRRLIPRWRPVEATLITPEALPFAGTQSKEIPTAAPDDFSKAVALWRETKAPGLLGEVLSFSVHEELVSNVIDVGQEAVQSGARITDTQSALLRDLQRDGSPPLAPSLPLNNQPHPFQSATQRLRRLLRSTPGNPLALLDYAQLQAAVGKLDSAEAALRTALALAPNNRLALRTLARFYVHAGNATLGHQIVRRHIRTPSDPWLMASEIALADAAGVESIFLAKAKRFFHDNKSLSSSHTTELAGVIAMAELTSGNHKRARDAQRLALRSPNDNVIAQAVDFQGHFGVALDTVQVMNALASSTEALSLRSWNDGAVGEIEAHSKAWHDEEPFSSRPFQLLTTLYAYGDDFELAKRWIAAGLVTDSQDSGLLTNLAFVQARQGDIAGALTTLRKLRNLAGVIAEPFAKATEGLIAYRQGRFDDGDANYDSAVERFNVSRPSVASYCRLNQALLAVEFLHPKADAITKQAQAALDKYTSADSVMLLKVRAMSYVNAKPQELDRPRLLSQWVFDAKTNTLTERSGVTVRGAPALVISKH